MKHEKECEEVKAPQFEVPDVATMEQISGMQQISAFSKKIKEVSMKLAEVQTKLDDESLSESDQNKLCAESQSLMEEGVVFAKKRAEVLARLHAHYG